MEVTPASTVLEVSDASGVGEARRSVVATTRSLGFSDEDQARAAIVATELGTNLIRHTTHGHGLLLTRPLPGATPGLEVLALDTGPGVADISRCLEDTVSAAGGPGLGLGAVRRLSDEFDIYSRPGEGTAVACHIWPRSANCTGFWLGAVEAALRGEAASGDGSAWFAEGSLLALVMVDGLGHGPMAAQAARAALASAQPSDWKSPAETMRAMHSGLSATRGVAAMAVAIDLGAQTLTYAGVGNVAARLLQPGGNGTRFVSHPGTLGHALRKVQEFTVRWQPGDMLVLHSDGISSRWNLDARPGLAARTPSLIAGVLFRDFGSTRDDASVLVARLSPGMSP